MSGWFGLGGGKEVEEPSGVEIVKKLSSRIASATLLEDRRDSVRAIKVISRDFKTTSHVMFPFFTYVIYRRVLFSNETELLRLPHNRIRQTIAQSTHHDE